MSTSCLTSLTSLTIFFSTSTTFDFSGLVAEFFFSTSTEEGATFGTVITLGTETYFGTGLLCVLIFYVALMLAVLLLLVTIFSALTAVACSFYVFLCLAYS